MSPRVASITTGGGKHETKGLIRKEDEAKGKAVDKRREVGDWLRD